MSGAEPLGRRSVVDELADRLRREIVDGTLLPGAPLRELELTTRWRVSRHTLRAALRQLAAAGLVTIEAHRGARVAALDAKQVVGLFEVRTALEVEAARLALERHGGLLPESVHHALAELVTTTCAPDPSWATIAARHAGLHGAIVEASGSARIIAEYARLTVELELFLLHLRPVWSLERMRTHHEELVRDLEAAGADALRLHLREGTEAVTAAPNAPPSSIGPPFGSPPVPL